ncbi:MAG: O-antigen ligase family protein [Alphaproteobacteria bacterium]|nr:O-antigen ligase family protein [Alphaproteobacteria bacterium]
MAALARLLPSFTLLLFILATTIGAFHGGMWASLGIGGAVILFIATAILDKRISGPQRDLTILALSALAIMGILNFQSFRPDISWEMELRLATIFLPLILLSAPRLQTYASHPKFFTTLLAAMVAGALTLSVELYLKGPLLHARDPMGRLTQYNRGLSYLIILAFPTMGFLWRSERRWLLLPFLCALLIPASLTESRSAKLALMLALPAIIIAQVWPVLARRGLALLPFLAIGWPFAAQQFFLKYENLLPRFPDSWRARMEIWDYMSYRIMEKPWLGWGLGTASSLPFQEPHGTQYVFTIVPAAHAHNAIVQLWVELGLPGVALGIAFALLLLRKASRLPADIAPFAIGAWVAALCLSMTAYNLWTDSLFACFALTGLAFALLAKTTPSRT